MTSDEQSRAGTSRRSWLRRALIVVAILLLVPVVAAAVVIGPVLLEPNHYAGVPSIEQRDDYRNPALMDAGWGMPVAAAYSRKSYVFQENQSFCGPASIANLLHSLGIDLSQDETIGGTQYKPIFGYLLHGLTLDELADLLRQRLQRPVDVRRDLSLDDFRTLLKDVNDPARRYVINFHRGPLFGRGHGHFSPILAYLPDRDLVLVGDVNATYRPFLVGSERLWRAMDTIDRATGRKRGLIVVDLHREASAKPALSRGPR